MMKFFRKHNRKLLAIFMALLLVVWLGGSALQAMFMPDRSKQVVATCRYGDIRVADQQAAEYSTSLLTQMRVPWSTPFGGRGDPLTVMDWVLLTREARDAGVMPTGGELDTLLPASLQNAIKQVAYDRDVKPDRIRAAFAEFFAVQQLQSLAASALVPSEAELRVAARNAYERVKIDAVALSANTFKDDQTEFSDAEVQEQFNAYRDSEPVPDTLTFGYYQQPRVKIEYIRIDPARIEENLRVSEDELERRARDFWRENRDNAVFRRPPTTQPADEATTQPVDEPTTQPAGEATTQPAQPESEFSESYTEARPAAHQAVRARLAAQVTENLTAWLGQQLAEVFFEADVGPNGYKVAPDEVKQAGYLQEIIQHAPSRIAYPEAVEIKTTDWFSAADAAEWQREPDATKVPGIGKARVQLSSTQSFRLAQLAFAVEGLAEIPTGGGHADEAREVYVAPYQFSPHALRGLNDELYLFRVVGVEAAHSPASVDLVRDKVIADLRLKSGFEQARAALEALKAQVEQGKTLADAWEGQEDLKAKVKEVRSDGLFENIKFAHRQLNAPPGFNYTWAGRLGKVDYKFVDDCFAVGNQPGEGPKLAIIEQPDSARVVLVQWLEVEPMTADQYNRERDRILMTLLRRRYADFNDTWTSSEQIHARTEFKWAGARKRAGAEEEEEAPATEEEAGGDQSDA